MNKVAPHIQPWLEAFAHVPPTPLSWLEEARQRALQQFSSSGFPTRRQENWKYTDVNPLLKHAFTLNNTHSTLKAEEVAALSLANWQGYTLIFVDGLLQTHLSQLPQQSGVYIAPLSQALEEHPQFVEKVFTQQTPWVSSFQLLNTLFAQHGSIIKVDDKTILDKPLQLLWISTQAEQACYTKNIIHLGKAAQAVVVENYQSLAPENAHYFNHIMHYVSLEEQAHLTHYQLQEEHIQAYHISQNLCQQARDSYYKHYQFDLGGRLSRHDLTVQLQGTGANCELLGLFMPQGVQHVDNHTQIEHCVPHTQSKEYYKGVLNERARAVFNGKVIVHEQAIKTAAALNNHNLLLSAQAEINTKPELEIYNDDVKCTHGATIGQLDNDALFYLQSRGIELAKARDLLIYGFAHDVVAQVELRPLRDSLDKILLTHLPKQLTLLSELW